MTNAIIKGSPCDRRGYKIGDLFLEEHSGRLMTLNRDDGSSSPFFRDDMGVVFYNTILYLEKVTCDPKKKIDGLDLVERVMLKVMKERFTSGDWKSLPTSTMATLKEIGIPDLPERHCVHMSEKHPGLIAYTPDGDLGRDRQVPCKLGKYLTSAFPEVASPDIARVANLFKIHCEEHLFKFGIARTADDMIAVYLNGPRSCMSKALNEFESQPYHPVEVYETDDVGVAYIYNRERDAYTARTVLNMKEKTYAVVYGNGDALKPMLEKEGYSYSGDGLAGCKLRMLRADSGDYVMPYLDGEQELLECSDHFIVGEGSDYVADGEYGLMDESGVLICGVCEDRSNEDDSYYSDYHDMRIGSCCISNYCEVIIGSSVWTTDYIHQDEPSIFEHDGRYYSGGALSYHNLGLDEDGEVHPAYDLVTTESGETWAVGDCTEYKDTNGDTCYIHDNNVDELVHDFFSDEMILQADANDAIDPQTGDEVYSYDEFELAQA